MSKETIPPEKKSEEYGYVGYKNGKLEPSTFATTERMCRYHCRAGFERIHGAYGAMTLEQLRWKIRYVPKSLLDKSEG